jgi:hypothetical protein
VTKPHHTRLFFKPLNTYVVARIVPLTRKMADVHIRQRWWSDPQLEDHFNPAPIDLNWDWNELAIEYEGRPLSGRKVAIVTGHGKQLAVQGAMLISSDPIPSILSPGEYCLFIELLFTAPWNRAALRKDGKSYFGNVGFELLRWAVRYSQIKGFKGRIRLDGSPEFLWWYEEKGLKRLELNPIVFRGVTYTPMELSDGAANYLLSLR